jgi:hypothetical protein
VERGMVIGRRKDYERKGKGDKRKEDRIGFDESIFLNDEQIQGMVKQQERERAREREREREEAR